MIRNNIGNITGKTLCKVVLLGATYAALAACQKTEGPAEHAGKEIDKATAQAGRQVEKAGESIQDAAKGDKK